MPAIALFNYKYKFYFLFIYLFIFIFLFNPLNAASSHTDINTDINTDTETSSNHTNFFNVNFDLPSVSRFGKEIQPVSNKNISTEFYKNNIFPNPLYLNQAIAIGLTHNLHVRLQMNQRSVQVYDLLQAQTAFEPQLTLSGGVSYNENNSTGTPEFKNQSANIGPGLSWTLPWGMQIQSSINYEPTYQNSAGENNPAYWENNFGYSITITQPLLQNFGTKVNEVGLDNAYDQQIIDDLNFRKTLQSTLIQIISDYYNALSAMLSEKLAYQNLQDASQELKQREAKFNAGQTPQIDLIQARLDLMTAQQAEENAKQTLENAKTTLLSTLGLSSQQAPELYLDPNAADNPLLEDQPKNLVLSEAITTGLKNNTNLKIDLLENQQAKRNIIKSEDAQRWSLDLTANTSKSYSNNTNPYLNTATQMASNSSVGLNLTIPLDQTSLNQTELSAAVSLNNTEITQAQEKTDLVNQITAGLENLNNQRAELAFSKTRLKLAKLTYQAAQIKYQYGKIDAFSLQQQKENQTNAEQTLINAKINYLKQALNYEALTGTLLNRFNIHIS